MSKEIYLSDIWICSLLEFDEKIILASDFDNKLHIIDR